MPDHFLNLIFKGYEIESFGEIFVRFVYGQINSGDIQTYRMTGAEVKTVLFRYIFGYYNTIRVNSFNPHGLPPVKLRLLREDIAA